MYHDEPAGTETSAKGHGFVAERISRAAANHAEQRRALGKGRTNDNAYYGARDSIPATHAKTKTEREGEMKKSMRGMGRVFLRGRVFWISFYHHGREMRESAETENEAAARKLLKRRLAETQTGRFIADEEKVTFENLVEGLITDYKLNGRKSLKSAALNNIKHLRGFFGFERSVDITVDRLKAYQLWRREQGASVATANREAAMLRRMFSVAIEAGKLSRRPVFKMLDGEKIRQGFVEHGDFIRLVAELPDHCSRL